MRFGSGPGLAPIVIASASGGQAHRHPTGRMVAGAGKTRCFHERLQQIDGMAVLLLPIGRQSRRGLCQQMAGQVLHAHPGQNHKPRVVAQQAQLALTLWSIPANPLIPRYGLPSRRAEQQAGQWAALPVPRQVLEVLPDAVAVPQIMITLQEELEEQRFGGAFGHCFQTDRLQALQRALPGPFDRAPSGPRIDCAGH